MPSFLGYYEEIIFVFGLQQLEYDVPRSGIFGIYPAYCSELLQSVICCLLIILGNGYASLICICRLGASWLPCDNSTMKRSTKFVNWMFACSIFIVRLGMVHILALYIPEKNVALV